MVKSEKTRKQMLNQADCLDKIRHMIFQASILPKELTPEQLALIKQRYAGFPLAVTISTIGEKIKISVTIYTLHN